MGTGVKLTISSGTPYLWGHDGQSLRGCGGGRGGLGVTAGALGVTAGALGQEVARMGALAGAGNGGGLGLALGLEVEGPLLHL